MDQTAITAAELGEAYKKDAAAADRLYKGRALSVSGRIENFLPSGPPPFGPLKALRGRSLMFFKGQVVVCVFSPEGKEAAAGLKPRQEVTVVGRFEGRDGERIILKDCVLK